MPFLDLAPDRLLTTTRSVRKRLDLARQVEPEVIRECLELAIQAPTASNSQNWHFVVVTDQKQRQALGEIYRKGYALYRQRVASGQPLLVRSVLIPEQEALLKKVRDSSEYLADHLHEVPVLLVPCIRVFGNLSYCLSEMGHNKWIHAQKEGASVPIYISKTHFA